MDYITSAVEVVVGSFFLGAVMGAIVALHLQTRRDLVQGLLRGNAGEFGYLVQRIAPVRGLRGPGRFGLVPGFIRCRLFSILAAVSILERIVFNTPLPSPYHSSALL